MVFCSAGPMIKETVDLGISDKPVVGIWLSGGLDSAADERGRYGDAAILKKYPKYHEMDVAMAKLTEALTHKNAMKYS